MIKVNLDKDTGLFQYRHGDISSLGGVLESAGKLFLYYSLYNKVEENKDVIHSILEAYRRYEVQPGFIPRTVSFSASEPAESKPNRWERPPVTSTQTAWLRTDVSHSQWFYFWTGLYIIDDFLLNNGIPHGLIDRVEERIKNNWKITRIDGKTAENGNFMTPGSALMRAFVISEIIGHKFSWMQNMKVALNHQFYTKQTWFHSLNEVTNKLYAVGFLALHNPKYKSLLNKILKISDKYLAQIEARAKNNQEGSPDFVIAQLDWLNIKKLLEIV